jgi:hypothetical protein
MPETNFTPSPFKALTDAGFSPDDARKAITTITAEGYDLPYITTIGFQLFAHSIEHADKIVEDSGIQDGPCEIRQGRNVLKINYLNIEGWDDFRDSDWVDHQADVQAEQAGVPEERTDA